MPTRPDPAVLNGQAIRQVAAQLNAPKRDILALAGVGIDMGDHDPEDEPAHALARALQRLRTQHSALMSAVNGVRRALVRYNESRGE